jgi:hypothetical protein
LTSGGAEVATADGIADRTAGFPKPASIDSLDRGSGFSSARVERLTDGAIGSAGVTVGAFAVGLIAVRIGFFSIGGAIGSIDDTGGSIGEGGVTLVGTDETRTGEVRGGSIAVGTLFALTGGENAGFGSSRATGRDRGGSGIFGAGFLFATGRCRGGSGIFGAGSSTIISSIGSSVTGDRSCHLPSARAIDP